MQKNHQEPLSEFGRQKLAEGRVEGRVEGRAAALIVVLTQRGLSIPEEIAGRIQGCREPERLDAWLRAAATAERIEDVFGD